MVIGGVDVDWVVSEVRSAVSIVDAARGLEVFGAPNAAPTVPIEVDGLLMPLTVLLGGGGPPIVLAVLLGGGGPRGGGGVALGVSGAVAPAFLLTHFFSSLSYTNELSSPRRALMGLLG